MILREKNEKGKTTDSMNRRQNMDERNLAAFVMVNFMTT